MTNNVREANGAGRPPLQAWSRRRFVRGIVIDGTATGRGRVVTPAHPRQQAKLASPHRSDSLLATVPTSSPPSASPELALRYFKAKLERLKDDLETSPGMSFALLRAGEAKPEGGKTC